MDWLGYIPDGLRPLILWGPILVAVGALFLVLKLGVKRRFLNTILNPMSSWLSRGFYILSICIVSGMLILIIAILPYLEPYFTFITPILDFIPIWFTNLLDIVGFIFALGTAIYTGILIMSVKYVPFWKTLLLPSLFTVSALSTGAMAVTLSTKAYNLLAASNHFPEALEHTLGNIEQVIVIIEILVIALYLFTRYKVGDYGRYSVLLLLSGKLKYVFWGGIVVTGFVIPLILEGIYSRLPEQHILLFVAGALLLIGGFFIRYATVYAGIKEEPAMLRLLNVRRQLSVRSGISESVQPHTGI